MKLTKKRIFICIIIFLSGQLFAVNPFEYKLNQYERDSTKRLSPLQRSLVEIGSIYLVRSLIYSQIGAIQDNDYESWSKGLKARFISKKAYRLDDNSILINHLGHAVLPAFETGLFRSNGMSYTNSFLMQLSASTFWEIVVEARETVSLNDLLVTPVAGSSISEVAFQFSRFFRKGKPTRFNKVMSGIFNGTNLVNDPYKNRLSGKNFDNYGFDADVYHEFKSFSSLYGSVSDKTYLVELGTEMQLINIKGYGDVGFMRHLFKEPITSDVSLDILGNHKSFGELDFSLQTMFFSHYSKNIRIDSTNILRGNSFLIGAATGYSVNYSEVCKPSDFLIPLHVIGLNIEWISFIHKVKLRFKSVLFGDFATVTSLLLDDYSTKIGGLKTAKNTLKKEHYYNAIGTTFNSELEVRKGNFSIGSKLHFAKFSSIENYDRHQEQVTNDFHLDDIRIREKVWASYFPFNQLELQLGYDFRTWKSIIAKNLKLSQQKDWVYCKLVFKY